ncbi:MAG TPA: PepSY-associated TM helix domain-containing protein [Thermoanaerobaculia bacterium]
MRWTLLLHRWIGLAAAVFLTVAALTGTVLLFTDSPAITQIHVRLFAGEAGEWIVNLATATLLLIVPTGLLLWWRRPRFTFRTSHSLKRTLYDLHNVLGFYSAVFVVLLAATGAFLGLEDAFGGFLGAQEWRIPDPPHSNAPDTPTAALDAAAFQAKALAAVPCATVTRLTLPKRRLSAVRVETRGPGAFDQRTVFLDRYSSAVLRIDDIAAAPLGYRMRAIALALHTGKVYGIIGKLVAFLGGVALAVLAVTGVWMWLR